MPENTEQIEVYVDEEKLKDKPEHDEKLETRIPLMTMGEDADVQHPTSNDSNSESTEKVQNDKHKRKFSVGETIGSLKTANTIFFSAVIWTISAGLLTVVPIAMIIIGSIYLDQCPAEPYIPIFLIVGGIFRGFKTALDIAVRCHKESLSQEKYKFVFAILSAFIFAWFIAGFVWIYEIYEPDYDPRSVLYCNRTLYLFSFWTANVCFIIILLYTCFACLISAKLLIHN